MDETQDKIEEENTVNADAEENEEILANFKRQKQKLLEENSIISDVTEVPNEIQEIGETSDVLNEPSPDLESPLSSNNCSSSDLDILKKLEDSESLITDLKSELNKKDELINTLSLEKQMMEKEKQMVSLTRSKPYSLILKIQFFF
jgi:hypothetical protein